MSSRVSCGKSARISSSSMLWTNVKTGRKGYAPACANEWVRDVCEKPRIKIALWLPNLVMGR